MNINITITENAKEHLIKLVHNNAEAAGVKLGVARPGTPKAETLLTYAKKDNVQSCTQHNYEDLCVYVEDDSIKWLDEATIDFNEEQFGGNLTIKAPNSKMPKLTDDSTLEERVNYYLWNDVYPMVAPHGGEVSLVEIDQGVAVLKFGGGCQGCAQVDVTLYEGVQKTLMDNVPELTGVRDVTDHSDTTNAFY